MLGHLLTHRWRLCLRTYTLMCFLYSVLDKPGSRPLVSNLEWRCRSNQNWWYDSGMSKV
jgi:hypothetical protein